MRTRLAAVLPLSCALAVVAACAAKQPNPPMSPTTPAPDGGAAVADAGMAPVASAQPDAGGPVYPTFFTGDAGSPTAPPGPGPGPAPLGDAASDMAIDVAVAALAPKVAARMDKEGAPGRQTLKEGEHFGMVVTLQPNRCYTFIGFSLPGAVSQLDLKLYAMPLNVEAGHSSPGDKAAPVMGKGAGQICPILPVAVPYKLDAVATKGAGRMGVYVYSRSK